MPLRLKQLWQGIRFCGDSLLSLGCWILWLALGLALLVQLGIAFTHELAVPKFALRSIEQRLQAAGLSPRFGRATFDPVGRVLLENVTFSLPQFAEPVLAARAVYVELDPWSLLVGSLEPERVRISGLRLFIPAMLAPSGRSQEIVGDLEVFARIADNRLEIEQLTTRVAGIAVTAAGAFELPPRARGPQAAPLPGLQQLVERFPDFCRRLVAATARLPDMDAPAVHIELTPSPTRGALAAVILATPRLSLPVAGQPISARDLRATVRVPVLGPAPAILPVALEAAEVRTPRGVAVLDVSAFSRLALAPAPLPFAPREIRLSARSVAAEGLMGEFPLATLESGEAGDFAAEFSALLLGQPLAATAAGDPAARSGQVRVSGKLSPDLLAPIGARVGRDLRPFVDFGAPVGLDVEARFLPGGKFENLTGRVAAERIEAHGVAMDSIAGEIEFDGRRFVARHALARLGPNFAYGTFEQDIATHEFRFLLDGRLQPMAIAGWFHDWWSHVFENFDFPDAPPTASVDVSGRWHEGLQTSVFLFVENRGAAIRGASFDYARSLLFIRPNFIDGLELFGVRGARELRGTFTRTTTVPDYKWREMTVAFTSTLDLENGAKLLGPEIAERLEPFDFAHPPQLRVKGRLDGPGAPEGEHHDLRIEARSTGSFSLYGFPAQDLSFSARLRDGEVTVDAAEAVVAEGSLTGKGRLWGEKDDRRLGFDAVLQGANLATAVHTVSNYLAARRGEGTAKDDKFLSGKSKVRLDLALSAEGKATDPYSFHGNGHATLEGPELGEVRLLGLLSALLDFTSLRFTSARGEFQLDGPKVAFPAVSVTGANSAIQAHGDYSLDRRQLDFNARVYPFQESKSLLQNVVGAVLTPLSTMLEVKLTGALDDPRWAFVIGPTNLLRSLGEPSATPVPTPTAPGGPVPTPPSPQESGVKTN